MFKRLLIVLASIIVVIAIVGSITISALANGFSAEEYYKLDEELFNKSTENRSTSYLAYSNGDFREYWSDDLIRGHRWVPIEEIGENLIKGFISAEDRKFYEHHGVNIKRTVGAMINYVTKKEPTFGASTITQQVIKNISGDNEISAKRKFYEIVRAIHLESIRDKDDILEVYLNIVPMTGNLSGVGIASRVYFGKEPSALSVSEAATIVGITNSPGRFNPYKHPNECLAKRNRVLFAMRENGAISEDEYNAAISEELGVLKYESDEEICSWFVETARNDAINRIMAKYGISSSAAYMMLRGSRVLLTVDINAQSILEKKLGDNSKLPSSINEGQSFAMTLINNETGDLVATVGGAGKKKGNMLFNMSEQAITPASTLKPLSIYAPLLDNGKINWSTVIDDTPISISEQNGEPRGYPVNSPARYDGLTTVSDAIRLSKNTVAMKLLGERGIDRTRKDLKERYGFVISDNDATEAGLSLGQISSGVNLRGLTAAYSAFARDGVISNPRSFYAILDQSGKIIVENETNTRRIYKSSTARIMTQLLSEVVNTGTARNLKIKNLIDTAGKTGTSSANMDRLFIGYTPYYTAGIWTGYPDRSKGVDNSVGAHLALWDEIMIELHDGYLSDKSIEEPRGFSVDGLLYLPYCRDSGNTLTELCRIDVRQNRVEYGYFIDENRPIGECRIHELVSLGISGLNYSRDNTSGIEIADSQYLIENMIPGFGLEYEGEE